MVDRQPGAVLTMEELRRIVVAASADPAARRVRAAPVTDGPLHAGRGQEHGLALARRPLL